MRHLHRPMGRFLACGFPPAAPVHLARRTRAVSMPAGLLARGSWPWVRLLVPVGTMTSGSGSPLTVARAAAFRQFPFQPLRATVICRALYSAIARVEWGGQVSHQVHA